MAISIGTRIKNAWTVFRGQTNLFGANYQEIGTGYAYRPDRLIYSRGSDRTIATSVYNRIALDAAAIDIKHVRLDAEGRFVETIDSGLNYCINVEANVDQTGRAFRQDIVASLLDEGCVAIVPVVTDMSPNDTSSYDILELRTGKVLEWFPKHVKVRVYNEEKGQKEDVILPKHMVGLVENPLYAVINQPNSIMQRLIRKLALLDAVDEQSGSGKLDLIIQLPYVVRGELKKQQAEQRRKEIERQLTGSKFGIAYTDATEHITQLNRSLENNLMKQIEYLTSMLYSQLGITQEIMAGTADEKTMLNYYNRTIEPIVSAVVDEIYRKFLTKTARTQKQAIVYFRDPFKLVPVETLAETADKLTRNEIVTSNEIRQIIGLKPSSDPEADVLRNKNLNAPEHQPANSSVPLTAEMNQNQDQISSLLAGINTH